MADAAAVVAAVARGAVAGTLFASAALKLRDRPGTRAALTAAGVPASLDRTLPLVEAFTGFGLVMERHTAWAAFVACGLLGAFTVFLVYGLTRPQPTPCPCFGAKAVAPNAFGIVRNLVLLALAVLATGSVATVSPAVAPVVAVLAAAAVLASVLTR